MSDLRLGIDVACRADHRASLADERGEFLWSSWRFRTTTSDLERLWAKLPEECDLTVIMEPTRNAWVPLAAWLRARGAKVVLVPPEQSADLRDYFNKHTKTDHLDSRVLARLPMLHPEGVRSIDDLGPGESLRRATRQRASLVKRRTTAGLRLDALVELLGPGWADTLGSGDYTKTSLVLLEKYADPRVLKRLGRTRLTALVIRTSHGLWRIDAAMRARCSTTDHAGQRAQGEGGSRQKGVDHEGRSGHRPAPRENYRESRMKPLTSVRNSPSPDRVVLRVGRCRRAPAAGKRDQARGALGFRVLERERGIGVVDSSPRAKPRCCRPAQ